jgi:signal transduction histidine kinase
VAETERRYNNLKQEQSAALMGILATEMAHELAKPLTHIMIAGSRLENTVKGLPKENLRTIEKEAQRASEILDGFAMLSPERTLHRIAVSLVGLVEEVLLALGLKEDDKIRIVYQHDFLSSIFVNPGQIVQVLTNVIENAWEAMPEGGTLTIATEAIRRNDLLSAVRISIIDTGHGVSPEIQKSVFEPFFTTKRSRGGRGVGLSISQAMVRCHGGEIRLESPIREGRGTRVDITLPIKNQEKTT